MLVCPVSALAVRLPFSFPLPCLGYFFPPCHKSRLIAAMKEDYAMQFISFDHSPASTQGRIHFVVSFPGPFDCWIAISRRLAVTHLAVDVAKVKLTQAIILEHEINFFLITDIIIVPLHYCIVEHSTDNSI